MQFDIDKQTIRDLNLFEERTKERSIFSVYNRTATKGGQEMMHKLLRTPVSDIESLQSRKEEIDFFFLNDCVLKLNSRHIDYIEHYLSNDRVPLRNNIIDAAYNGFLNKLSADGDYWIISNGILYSIRLLFDLKSFVKECFILKLPATLMADFDQVKTFIESNVLKNSFDKFPEDIKDLTFTQINNLDHFIRVTKKKEFRELLNIVYKIDVLQTLARIMKTDGFTLPEYVGDSQPIFEVVDAFYPILTLSLIHI